MYINKKDFINAEVIYSKELNKSILLFPISIKSENNHIDEVIIEVTKNGDQRDNVSWIYKAMELHSKILTNIKNGSFSNKYVAANYHDSDSGIFRGVRDGVSYHIYKFGEHVLIWIEANPKDIYWIQSTPLLKYNHYANGKCNAYLFLESEIEEDLKIKRGFNYITLKNDLEYFLNKNK